jgi:hypothetical protein
MFLMNPASKVLRLILLILVLLNSESWAEEYSGAESCKECHEREYNQWQESGHAHILSRIYGSGSSSVDFPEGYDETTVSYIIGGFRWKTLFLDKNGYLITSTPKGPGKNQYNIQGNQWTDHLLGQKVVYGCGKCHTTGYESQGHQNGLEGIQGTWKFDGVQCEVCHGPGTKHAHSTLEADITIQRNLCPKCHGTEPFDMIPMSGVFLAPYTEANQLLASDKRDFLCSECHNPHAGAKSIKQSCVDCHVESMAEYTGSIMDRVGVTCLDCHMAPAGIVATGDADAFHGDFKSHVFNVDYRKPFPEAKKNGTRVNPGYLTVDYACMRCHQTYENRSWAVRYSMFVHSIKVTTDVKIKRFQFVFCAIGFFFALVAFLSALSLKNWLWPTRNKKRMLAVHKHCAWIACFIWWFMSATSIYFLFPFDNPAQVFNLGWFFIHLIGGALGLTFYIGKILAVRVFKKGWKWQGAFWGIGLFVFWLLDFLTVLWRRALDGAFATLLF